MSYIHLVTSMNEEGYHKYGKRMLESVKNYLDPNIQVTVWYHDFDLTAYDIPAVYNISYRNLNDVDDMLEYREAMKHHDGTEGGSMQYNWRLDAIKWCHKVFAMTETAFEMAEESIDPGWMIWLDADTVFNHDMSYTEFMSLLPEESGFVHLGRRDTDYSETSFMGFNLKYKAPLDFLGDLRGCYVGREVVGYREWHDGFIIERLLNIYKAHGMSTFNMTPNAKGLDAFGQSPLAGWMEHFKGNKKDLLDSSSKDKISKAPSTTEVAPDVNGPKRYQQLLKLVDHYKPEVIAETGCWNGGRAIQMATIAFQHTNYVEYYGFDLFEEATVDSDQYEMNSKAHNSLAAVQKRLLKFADKMKEKGKSFSFKLFKGDSKETFKDYAKACDLGYAQWPDFVYIDGGHSYETCSTDYENFKDVPVVVIDDYFTPDKSGAIPPDEHCGTNTVMKSIKDDSKRKVVLPSSDPVLGGGITHLGVVLKAGYTELPPELTQVPIVITPKDCMPDDYIKSNVVENMKLITNWDFVKEHKINKKDVFIVSGGKVDYNELRNAIMNSTDNVIVCVKHALPALMKEQIYPDYCVILDPRSIEGTSTHGVVRKDLFNDEYPYTKFLIASMTDPSVTKHLLATHCSDVIGWHAYTDAILSEDNKVVDPTLGLGQNSTLVTGGTCAAMRAIGMFHILGCRSFHLFGFDCSVDAEDVNRDAKTEDGKPKFLEVELDGKYYWTTGELLAMAQDCEKLFERTDIDFSVEFYGHDTLARGVYDKSSKSKETEWLEN